MGIYACLSRQSGSFSFRCLGVYVFMCLCLSHKYLENKEKNEKRMNEILNKT